MDATTPQTPPTGATGEAGAEIPVRGVSFPVLQADSTPAAPAALNRFYDVKVTVTVELGRIAIPIGDLLQLGPGSIVELDRTVSEPADVMAQGVRLGRGEIIVVDDRYAVRMLQIETDHAATATDASKQSSPPTEDGQTAPSTTA